MPLRLDDPDEPPPPPEPEYPEAPMIYVIERQAWEYKTLTRRVEKGEAPIPDGELQALGGEGWELAGVAALAPQVSFYFKRLKDG